MRLKPVLLLFLLAFFSLTSFTVKSQCHSDAEYSVSFDSNKAIIAVQFNKTTTGVAFELVDLLNSKKGVIQTKKLATVTKGNQYTLFENLKDSIYGLTITADDCDEPKFGVKTIEVGGQKDDE